MIRVCKDCHCDPCQCMSFCQQMLILLPLMGCMLLGGFIADWIAGSQHDMFAFMSGTTVGGIVGFCVAIALYVHYGEKK